MKRRVVNPEHILKVQDMRRIVLSLSLCVEGSRELLLGDTERQEGDVRIIDLGIQGSGKTLQRASKYQGCLAPGTEC